MNPATAAAAPKTSPAALRPPLRRGVVWATAGNGIYLGCQYGMLMAVAKFGDPAAVGQFALALAIAAPVIVVSQMQLRQLQVTDVRGEAEFGDYLWHRLLLTAAALLVIVIIAVGYGLDAGLVIALIGVAKGFESISDVAYGRLQRHERMDLVAVSMIAKGVLSLVVLAVLMSLLRDLIWAVAGLAAVWAVMLLAFDLPVQRRATPGVVPRLAFRYPVLKLLTRTALPLAWTAGLVSLSANVPRYFLDGMHGREAVAIFAIAAMPLILANMLAGSVLQAVLPRAATYFQQGQLTAFHRIGLALAAVHIGFGLLVAAVFAIAGTPLITTLFTAEYVAAVPLIIVMSLGTAIGGIGAYGATVLAAGRRFTLQFYNVATMVALQVVICYALIGRYGVVGAGWAELIRYAASAIFLLVCGWCVVQARARVITATPA